MKKNDFFLLIEYCAEIMWKLIVQHQSTTAMKKKFTLKGSERNLRKIKCCLI